MFMANGTPSVRIWVVGTRRILGVVQQDESLNDLPANIRRAWHVHGDEAMWASDLYGAFTVCGGVSRPGRMRMVSVREGSQLQVRVR
jgi:hypothetical protein